MYFMKETTIGMLEKRVVEERYPNPDINEDVRVCERGVLPK